MNTRQFCVWMPLVLAGLLTSAAAAAAPGDANPALPVVAVEKISAAIAEVVAAQDTRNAEERDAHFRKARQFYQEGLDETAKTIKATADPVERGRLRVQNLRVRLDLANMIFDKWLKTDLDLLEVSDRRFDDQVRTRATELLKDCTEQYRSVTTENAEIQRDADMMPEAERKKFLNTWSYQLKTFQRQADYTGAWVTYYYGWVLPADFKPAKGELSKAELLESAAEAFKPFTQMSEKVSARYYALMVIGLAYRELGKYPQALEALAKADDCKVLREDQSRPLKIRIGYERALTLLRKGDFQACHKAVADMQDSWKDTLETSLHGIALPMVEGECWILEGRKTGDKALIEKGLAEFNKVAGRGGLWWRVAALVGHRLLPGEAEPAVKIPPAKDVAANVLPVRPFVALAEVDRGFFGAGSAEQFNKIVYVIDRSGSMTDSINVVKMELKRSIFELYDDKEFHVIFYSTGAPVENPPRKLVKATERNKMQAVEFIDDVATKGETDPSEAIRRAFDIQPELIYLLTDGDFAPEIATLCKTLNKDRKVTIHTIGFMHDIKVLQEIAKQNNGDYKFVTDKDIERLGR